MKARSLHGGEMLLPVLLPDRNCEKLVSVVQIPFSAKISQVEVVKSDESEYHPHVVASVPYDDGVYQNIVIIDLVSGTTTTNNSLVDARYVGMYWTPETGTRHVFQRFLRH